MRIFRDPNHYVVESIVRAFLVISFSSWLLSCPALSAVSEKKAPPEVDEYSKTITEAHLAFRKGDDDAALARLRIQVGRNAKTEHEDLQVGRLLSAVVCQARNSGTLSAVRSAISLALAKLGEPQGRMSATESAEALSLTGEINEMAGSSSAAIKAYRQALEVNPKLERAQQRLTHLLAVDAQAKEKAAANDLLFRRSQFKPIQPILPRQ